MAAKVQEKALEHKAVDMRLMLKTISEMINGAPSNLQIGKQITQPICKSLGLDGGVVELLDWGGARQAADKSAAKLFDWLASETGDNETRRVMIAYLLAKVSTDIVDRTVYTVALLDFAMQAQGVTYADVIADLSLVYDEGCFSPEYWDGLKALCDLVAKVKGYASTRNIFAKNAKKPLTNDKPVSIKIKR